MQNNQTVAYIFHESAPMAEEIRSVKESKRGNSVIMEVVLQEAELPNRNLRKYPKQVLVEGLKAPRIMERIKMKSLLGESTHPSDASVQRQMTIDHRNISHIIHEYYWDPKDSNILLGKVETADTHIGRDFAGLVRQGMQASFSMRGIGDVIKEGAYVRVKGPLNIVTWDSVNFPSHEKAYQRSILAESAMANDETAIPVSVRDLARYAADNSKDFASLNEQVLCIAKDSLDFTLSESGKLEVFDKTRGDRVAIMLLETNLEKEVSSIMRRIV